MKTRIMSSIIFLPILVFLVAYGGIFLKIGVLFASLIGMNEFYKAFSGGFKPIHSIGYIFAIIYMIFINEIINASNIFNVFASLFLVVILTYVVLFHAKTNIVDGIVTFFGYFYVCFLISHIFLIREYTYGKFFVWLIFISAWGCDTGAYFSGMAFGKHKLIPELSPKKTVEGAIGGVIVATLLAAIYGICIERSFPLEGVDTVRLCVLTAFIGSFLSQIGDLAASAMKRFTKIKDFGKLIPGHGGIIDRFDSVLFTAPVVYYIMLFLIEIN